MADLSDVETSLAAAVVAAVYPNGTSEASVAGTPVRVYRGWPMTGALDLDLAAGIANVSVFAMPDATRNTTRWGIVTKTIPGTLTLTVDVNGNSATFGGTGGTSQVAGLLVQNQTFVYRGNAGDTPVLVAAVLAERVRVVRACWLSGATVSVPGVSTLVARTVADGTAITQWGRQEQGIRITAWCPTPASRDLLCATIGNSLSATAFIGFADQTAGRLRYRSTASFDELQDGRLYRRDLVYDVDYATTQTLPAPSMLFGDLDFDGNETYC